MEKDGFLLKPNKRALHRQYNYLVRLFCTVSPFHEYGRDEDNKVEVEKLKAELIKEFRQEHPGADNQEIKRHAITFLSAACKVAFEQLPVEEREKWVQSARRTDPLDEEER